MSQVRQLSCIFRRGRTSEYPSGDHEVFWKNRQDAASSTVLISFRDETDPLYAYQDMGAAPD